MIHVTLNPKSTGAALAVLIAGLLSAASAKAQTLYFDPTMMGGDTGGSGTFDMTTSDFYNGTTDQPFTAGATAEFDGSGGTVTVSGVVDPAAIGFDATGAYTVGADSTGTIAEGTSTSLNITNGGSSSATVSAPITFTGTGGNGNNDANLISVNVANTGSGSLVFGSTVTNTPETVAQGGTGMPQFFQVDVTQGTVEFDGNITGANTGYDPSSGSSTNDNITVAGGATALIDNSNFDRFQVAGGTLLTNGAITVAATNSFSFGNGTIGGATADTSTFSGSIANFGGTQYLTAVAGGRVNFTGDLNGGSRTIEGAGIIDIAADTHYAEQYGSGSETFVGTDILSGGTLLITNTSGSATGNGTQQNSSNGSNNLVMIESGGTLGGTGITQQNVVTAGGTSTISPGEMTNAKVSSIGTLHLDNGLNAANGLTVNFDLNGTNHDQVQLASATTSEYGPVPDGAVATELVLGGTDTFKFNNLGTVLTNNDYALFTFDTGSYDLSDASYDLEAPTGYTASTPFLVTDGATESLDVTFSANPVPEPSTWALMGLAGLVLIGSGKLRRLRA